MPGITLFKITTTRGIELSQSLCRMTFHGSSGLTLFRVRLRLSFLLFVATMIGGILVLIPVKRIDRIGCFCVVLRTKPDRKVRSQKMSPSSVGSRVCGAWASPVYHSENTDERAEEMLTEYIQRSLY